MGEQQQPVDDFAPRANLKRLFKDGAILSGDSEKVKGEPVSIFVEERHMLEYIITFYIITYNNISAIGENFGLYSLDSRFGREGALKI